MIARKKVLYRVIQRLTESQQVNDGNPATL